MNIIYLQEYNSRSDRHLIIDGDIHSAWVYLINKSSTGQVIEFDGFLCSRGTLIKTSNQIKEYIDNSFQPPLLEKFSNQYCIQADLKEQDITIDWQDEIIKILIKSEVFLIMDIKDQKSFSKSISAVGPYGYPLNN